MHRVHENNHVYYFYFLLSLSGMKKQGMYRHKASNLEVDTSGRLAMSLSDFEVAAGRARVHGLEESKMHTHKPVRVLKCFKLHFNTTLVVMSCKSNRCSVFAS